MAGIESSLVQHQMCRKCKRLITSDVSVLYRGNIVKVIRYWERTKECSIQWKIYLISYFSKLWLSIFWQHWFLVNVNLNEEYVIYVQARLESISEHWLNVALLGRNSAIAVVLSAWGASMHPSPKLLLSPQRWHRGRRGPGWAGRWGRGRERRMGGRGEMAAGGRWQRSHTPLGFLTQGLCTPAALWLCPWVGMKFKKKSLPGKFEFKMKKM